MYDYAKSGKKNHFPSHIFPSTKTIQEDQKKINKITTEREMLNKCENTITDETNTTRKKKK